MAITAPHPRTEITVPTLTHSSAIPMSATAAMRPSRSIRLGGFAQPAAESHHLVGVAGNGIGRLVEDGPAMSGRTAGHFLIPLPSLSPIRRYDITCHTRTYVW